MPDAGDLALYVAVFVLFAACGYLLWTLGGNHAQANLRRNYAHLQVALDKAAERYAVRDKEPVTVSRHHDSGLIETFRLECLGVSEGEPE